MFYLVLEAGAVAVGCSEDGVDLQGREWRALVADEIVVAFDVGDNETDMRQRRQDGL